jgi:hemerythrin-like domain-containing protein
MPQKNDNENWLLHDHKKYNAVVHELRDLVRDEAWRGAEDKFCQLSDDLEDHMAMEEQVIFPFYDLMIGTRNSSTGEMRREHDRIRGCLISLSRSLESQDTEEILYDADSLDRIMDAHHDHEEGAFLPHASQILLEKRSEVIDRLHRRDWSRKL